MRRHWAYLKYVLLHKWYVLQAGIRTGAPIFRLLVHDWSKFRPSEWLPYARTFYDERGGSQYQPDPNFDQAWNHHQKRNKHHWQYWLLKKDNGKLIPLPMPLGYVKEMVADWAGAGRAIHGRWEVTGWYEKNRQLIILHPKTRGLVEALLQLYF